MFGDVVTNARIWEFRSVKKTTSLDVFPLRFHKDRAHIWRELIANGRRFVSLVGVTHCEYNGLAYLLTEDGPESFMFRGRMMIDAAEFRNANPNYLKPRVNNTGCLRNTHGPRRTKMRYRPAR